ncbi:alpha/beta fold hydrolase [Tsukamurella paurometabola]|uniref:Pimelyl-[acyl-carrier protein] methyl ester esterase n=1 Tax=Tsukamurella paurometabola TaxID=2061 RepID=A0A3P8KJN5_TSUPA|nr:alpha/beta hydrolase [Tsukamurella paurometabola]UEA83589.1 alpha/beta hydrolase [Tsukamurella paurometabola]VDR40718.1 Pimelyl-[acyl-carrier protein] methyl ester esterase [Tsukamurella paurometabola]
MYSGRATHILSESGTAVVDRGAGPVVALAHGAGGGVLENFSVLLDHAPGLRFVGPSWPGSGGTPLTAAPLALEDLADRTVAAAVSRGAVRFPIVGLSLGAAVAVTAAHRHPDHVSALVLTVGVARSDFRVRTVTDTIRVLASAGVRDELAAYVVSVASSDATLRVLPQAEIEEARIAVRDTMPEGMAAQFDLAGRVDVTGLLPGIAVPTMVVVAGGDRLVPADIAREFGAIPGSRVVEYAGAGHIFTPPEAGEWAGEVADFLRATE